MDKIDFSSCPISLATWSMQASKTVVLCMQTLDRKLSTLEAGTSQAAYGVDSAVADVEDLLSYANDVLNTGWHLAKLSEACLEGIRIL